MGTFEETISSISKTARKMHKNAWADDVSGNISVLMDPSTSIPGSKKIVFQTEHFLPELEGSSIIMTRSGSKLGDIPESPEENLGLFHVGKGGSSLELVWGSGAPTSEYLTHLLIYARSKGRVKAVIHCHMEEVELLQRELMDLAPDLPEWIGWVPNLPPGSMDLAQATVQEMDRYDIMFWYGHGIIAPGKDLEDALGRLERFSEWSRSILEMA